MTRCWGGGVTVWERSRRRAFWAAVCSHDLRVQCGVAPPRPHLGCCRRGCVGAGLQASSPIRSAKPTRKSSRSHMLAVSTTDNNTNSSFISHLSCCFLPIILSWISKPQKRNRFQCGWCWKQQKYVLIQSIRSKVAVQHTTSTAHVSSSRQPKWRRVTILVLAVEYRYDFQ